MMLTYHNEIVGTIRPSVKEDCFAIAKNMRKQDALGAWSVLRFSPIEMAMYSFNKSFVSMTIEHNGIPVAMFGIMAKNLMDDSGILWLLTTDGINDIGRIFVRNSKKWIQDMFEFYPLLQGLVDLRNTVSVRWLNYLGCEWGITIPYGIDKMPFKYFSFRKKHEN